MTEPVNKVCASCVEKCKQAAFVKVIGCPAYKAKVKPRSRNAPQTSQDGRERVKRVGSVVRGGATTDVA